MNRKTNNIELFFIGSTQTNSFYTINLASRTIPKLVWFKSYIFSFYFIYIYIYMYKSTEKTWRKNIFCHQTQNQALGYFLPEKEHMKNA